MVDGETVSNHTQYPVLRQETFIRGCRKSKATSPMATPVEECGSNDYIWYGLPKQLPSYAYQ